MEYRVMDAAPPVLLVEAAAAYSAWCCSGSLDLARDGHGFWQATMTHDLGCPADGTPIARPVTAQPRPAAHAL